jgi:deoxyribodipyrimidine photo-lyase
MVPEIRIQTCNSQAANPHGDFVIYWMIAHRRVNWNFGLQRAVEWAEKFSKPLIILETLRCDYRWASDRIHKFILAGMADNARRSQNSPAICFPYVEPAVGAGQGLLAELSRRACVIVTDDFPCFFLPRMAQSAARRVVVRMEKVDSNGLLPMRVADQDFKTAYAFRRFLQKTLPDHLLQFPKADPLRDLKSSNRATIPNDILKRWPMASAELLAGNPNELSRLPIDHSVPAVETRGGGTAAEKCCDDFIENRLRRYAEDRNQPELDATSGLSCYLHFGHISVHQILKKIFEVEDWNPARLARTANGHREGWWGMSPAAETFLDELITWREVGYNFCFQRNDYDHYDSLPDWAKATLAEHAADPREFIYSLEEFENAKTHDPLWNAAQLQLRREGRIHNYLRMLWGKKILEWSRSPQEALEIMIELNNKYALDGRNPNSYSGIFWVLGRYDRPWGPERPIFGKVRYMSSENTARKFRVRNYISRYA